MFCAEPVKHLIFVFSLNPLTFSDAIVRAIDILLGRFVDNIPV